MLYCKWLIVTSGLQFLLYKDPIHLVLIQYLYKDPNQVSHLYKEYVKLYIYHNFMPYQFFLDRYINILPLTTRKIENDMVLITISTGYFLIIWESNDPWFMSSLRPYDLYQVSSRNFLNNYELYPHLFLFFILTNICYTKQILYCHVFWDSGFKKYFLWKVILFCNYFLISIHLTT